MLRGVWRIAWREKGVEVSFVKKSVFSLIAEVLFFWVFAHSCLGNFVGRCGNNSFYPFDAEFSVVHVRRILGSFGYFDIFAGV